jgi:prevent-host-death family protein
VERTVAAFEARRNFGRVLEDVAGRGDTVVVERHGEAVAALVPMRVYEQWKRRREAFFDHMEEVSKRVNLSPEEADALVEEAILAVRAKPEA